MLAVNSGNKTVLDLLIKAGANTNARNIYGTALTFATYGGQREIMKKLLNAGACPDIGGERTALIIATIRDDFDSVSLLLDHNADPLGCGSNGKNAISYASNLKHLDVLRLLEQRKVPSTKK